MFSQKCHLKIKLSVTRSKGEILSGTGVIFLITLRVLKMLEFVYVQQMQSILMAYAVLKAKSVKVVSVWTSVIYLTTLITLILEFVIVLQIFIIIKVHAVRKAKLVKMVSVQINVYLLGLQLMVYVEIQ